MPRFRVLATCWIICAPTLDAAEFALRFFGNGASAPGLDRVVIQLEDPHRPVDIGTGDFTIEWWVRANISENQSPPCSAGRDNWIYGNIILDRDIFGPGDHGDWGVSLAGGVIAFGVDQDFWGNGLCGSTVVADGAWHHVAVTRREADGLLRIWVDGRLDAEASNGPTGDLSYRDGRSADYPWDPYLVIGAEKHDLGGLYPSFSGWLDELRLSNIVRYETDFDPPAGPFVADVNTAALYHFDEGVGSAALDSSGAEGGPSHGNVRVGGEPAGPIWTNDSPFADVEVFADGFEGGDVSRWSHVVGWQSEMAGY